MQVPTVALATPRTRQRGAVVTLSRAGHAVRVRGDGAVRRGAMEPECRAPINRPAGTRVA
jgi:hypothetical protein